MTRSEKIRKLGNAVRDFRGMYRLKPDGSKGGWIHPPQLMKMERVAFWIAKLNLPVDETLHKIRMFKSWQEFNEWVKTL